MKNGLNILVIAVSIMLTAFSCEDLIELKFTTSPQVIKLDIPPSKANLHFDTVIVVKSNLQEEVEKNGGLLTEVQKISVNKIKLTISSEKGDFNSFESIEVLMTNLGLDDKKIGWKDLIPMDVNEFTLEFTDDNLLDFLNQDEYTFSIEGKTREESTEYMSVDISFEFDIEI